MNIKNIRSEIERLSLTLIEGMKGPEMILPSRVEAIETRVIETLYPVAESVNITSVRAELIESLENILYASQRFLECVDTDEIDSIVVEAVNVLKNNMRKTTSLEKLHNIVSEELKKSPLRIKKKLTEAPIIQAGNVEKLANDSIDVALDSYFDKVGDTLDASGTANKEPNKDGAEGEQEFSAVDFSSDISNLVDRVDTLLDLRGTIARRAINHVYEKYGADAADNVKQILSANFDITVDSVEDAEGERNANRPVAVGAGGSGGTTSG